MLDETEEENFLIRGDFNTRLGERGDLVTSDELEKKTKIKRYES